MNREELIGWIDSNLRHFALLIQKLRIVDLKCGRGFLVPVSEYSERRTVREATKFCVRCLFLGGAVRK
jgi:hypothetical protein